MGLVEYAQEELKRAGLYDADSDYDGGIGLAVEELVKTFAGQGHSGYSAQVVLKVFGTVAQFQPLTPLTNDPGEWIEREGGLFQSRRRPDAFSKDGGKTYYLLDDPDEDVYTAAEPVSTG
jgi:hypothetical protein